MKDTDVFIGAVIEDVKAMRVCKYIRPFDVKQFGYVFSKEKIRLNQTAYEIREVLHADSQRPASFCLLLSRQTLHGVALKHNYDHYHRLAQRGTAVRNVAHNGDGISQAEETTLTKAECQEPDVPGVSGGTFNPVVNELMLRLSKFMEKLLVIEDQMQLKLKN